MFWYVMLKACSSYVMWLLRYMIWYDMCMMWTVMCKDMKMWWYEICATWMIYDMIDMKYNSDTHMEDVIKMI